MPQKYWPHAPEHRLTQSGAFIVTAGTYQKEPLFHSSERLNALCDGLLKYAAKHEWRLQAWAIFPNHYHFVALSPEGASGSLSTFLRELHSRSARWLNKLDNSNGRKVWHNYWETHLTIEESYYARLNYVHQNAVKHKVAAVASQYPWCSASWFEKNATKAFENIIYGTQTELIKVKDDF